MCVKKVPNCPRHKVGKKAVCFSQSQDLLIDYVMITQSMVSKTNCVAVEPSIVKCFKLQDKAIDLYQPLPAVAPRCDPCSALQEPTAPGKIHPQG